MKIIVSLTAGLFWVLVSSTQASAEFAMRNEEVADSLNSTARKIGAPIAFSTRGCSDGIQHVCQLAGTDVGVIASSDPGQRTKEITVIFVPGDGDGFNAILSWGTLIAMVTPNATAEARGHIVTTLSNDVIKKRESESSLIHEGVKFTLLNTDSVGLWFIANSEPDN